MIGVSFAPDRQSSYMTEEKSSYPLIESSYMIGVYCIYMARLLVSAPSGVIFYALHDETINVFELRLERELDFTRV